MNSIFKILLSLLILTGQFEFSYAQSASILPPAKTTFVDKNGKPLTSGTVDFYIPGTTTRKMTWQDAGQTIPNANPLTLDGSGRATILGDGSYRQVLKDRYGNVVWDGYTASTGSGGGGTTPTVGDGDAVGTIKPWAGFIAPYGYVFAYGQELVRASYPEAFAAMTSNQNVTCTLGSPTLTGVSSTSQLPIGAPIESSCLNAGATILSKTINSVTATSNAIISTTSTARFFPFGNGDGSLTFNTPDLRGLVIAGADNMGGVSRSKLTNTYYLANPNAIGATGGSQSHTMTTGELVQHNHTATTTNSASTFALQINGSQATVDNTSIVSVNTPGTSSVLANAFTSQTPSVTIPSAGLSLSTSITNTGSTNPFTIVQPTITANYIIKIIPDSNPNSFFGVASIGGMYGVLECGVGLTCAGNVISAVNSQTPTPTPISLGGVFQSNAPANQFAIGVDLAGNILYAGGSTTVNGQVCTIGGTCTITASAGTITVGITTLASGSPNAILYNNGGTLGDIATANNAVMSTNGSGVPSMSTTLPSGLTIPSPTINSGALSGTFTGAPTFSGTNFIANSNLAQVGAATLKGNPTVSTANVQDFTIQGLTNLPSPDPTLDFVPIYDAGSGTIKKATPQAIASAGVAGVASIGGLTGVVGTASGITTSGSNVVLDQTWQGFITTATFGDTGDGTTDDTTAIQNCINYSASTPYVTCILRGSTGGYNHKITTRLTFPTGSSLVGASNNQTLTFTSAANASGIALSSNYTTATFTYSVNIANLIVDVTANSNIDALFLGDASSWTVNNVVFNLGTNAGMRGALIQQSTLGCSCYNRFYNVTMNQGVTGWEVSTNGNSNTFIGIRTNQSVTGFKATAGNDNTIISPQFENATNGFTMGASAISVTLAAARFENVTTAISTTAGATRLQVINPYFSSVAVGYSDTANALINSPLEYRITVPVNQSIPANSTSDIGPITTGVMAGCLGPAEVTAAADAGGTVPSGLLVTGLYRTSSTGPYIRVGNLNSTSSTLNANVILTCRVRSK